MLRPADALAGTIASDGQHAKADAHSFDRLCRVDLILTVDLPTTEQALALGTSARSPA